MLLIVVPILWLATAAFVVLLCRAAADADAVQVARAGRVGPRTAAGATSIARDHARRTWRRPAGRAATRAAERAGGARVGRWSPPVVSTALVASGVGGL